MPNRPPSLDPGMLFVIATPIGNLEDLSPRAREVLSTVEQVLCEDTRRTAKLMMHFGFHASLERFDAYAGPEKMTRLVESLHNGSKIALVSDAGTPAISDPGAKLVRLARISGVPVVPIAGPSAVTALLSVSGMDETAFTFRGFFPRGEKEGTEELEIAIRSGASSLFVWFESPERIGNTVLLLANLRPEAEMIVGKELTKIHETFFFGSAFEVNEQVQNHLAQEGKRGEWCFAVLFQRDQKNEDSDESDHLNSWIEDLLSGGMSVSGIVHFFVKHLKRPHHKTYGQVLEIRRKIFPGGD